MTLYIYLISQTERKGYDTYDSAVVCAPSREIAEDMHPDGDGTIIDSQGCWADDCYSWTTTNIGVSAKCLGLAASGIERGFLCKSFNAG